MNLSKLRSAVVGSRTVMAAWQLARPVMGGLARRLPERWRERVVLAVETPLKRLAFDCRSCGNCVVSDTGLVCPMTCAKTLRNGPCGGVRADGTCEVQPGVRCTWVEAWRGRRKLGQGHKALPPADHRLARRSTWIQSATTTAVPAEPRLVHPTVPTPPMPGRLESALVGGRLVATAEIPVFDGIEPAPLLSVAGQFSEVVTAFNVTDGAGAHPHAASMAVAATLFQAGHVPIMQLTCRDRNRIALQSDLVGAALLGIENVVCLTGDSVQTGDHPQAKPVFDLDSISLLASARTLADGSYLSGRKLDQPLPLFIGAVENPFAAPVEIRPERLAAKIDAGACFIQTQYCFDVSAFRQFMARAGDLGLLERCFILVGIGPLVSAGAARRMCARVPGIHVPDALIARLERAGNPAAEGVAICAETMAALAEIPGVRGFHLMAHRRGDLMLAAVERSGLASRLNPREPRAVEDDSDAARTYGVY